MSTKRSGGEPTLEQQLQREYTARRGDTTRATRAPAQQTIMSEVHVPRGRGPSGGTTSTTQYRQHVSMASRLSPTTRRARVSLPPDQRYRSLEMGRGTQQQQHQQQHKIRGGAYLESGTMDIPRRSPKRQRPHYEQQTSESPVIKRRDTTRRGHGRSPSQSATGQPTSSWMTRTKR